MKTFIGLGNHEEKYTGTRHNVGKDFLIWFAQENNFSEFEFDKYSNGKISKGNFNGKEVQIFIPETFMNLSGEAVSVFLKNKEVDASEIFVFHDDIDMNFGDVKKTMGQSGSGGHNGIKSLFEQLKFEDFTRIKFGIIPKTLLGGFRKPARERVSSSVLNKFSFSERTHLKNIYKKVAELIK